MLELIKISVERYDVYFYEQLTPNQKVVYKQLLNAINQMQTTVNLSGKRLTIKDLGILLRMIENDNPGIFWIERTYNYKPEANNNSLVYSYSPIYRFSMTQRKSMEQEILNNEKYFFSGIRFSMTPYEKALRIYENIPRLMKYDKEAIVGERKKRREYRLDDCSTIYGGLVLRKAVCAGYAKSYQYLLHKVGVECVKVNGNTSAGYHGWNIVNLENAWYHIDVTWGDYLESFTDGYISYAWFGLSDSDVLRTRTMDNDLSYPSCKSNACNYFVKNELYYLKWNRQVLQQCIKQFINANAQRRIQLRFSSEKEMKEAWDFLSSNDLIFKLYYAENKHPKTIWHSFNEDTNVLVIWPEYGRL